MNVAIVQARMGSTRLPGKVLRALAGIPVLDHVLARVRAIPKIDLVCCAIPVEAENDGLAARAASLGATVTRGPEADVLTRYVIAARATKADVVMRVTSDCPLLDPAVSGQVLADFLGGSADYVSNVNPRSWPRGLDTEVFSVAALEQANVQAKESYQREHVTPWMRSAPHLRCRNVALETDRFVHWRWTLDYEADLRFMEAALAHLAPFPYLSGFDEIRAVVDAHPEIAAINADLV